MINPTETILAESNGVCLSELDGAFLLDYQDCGYKQSIVFFDWTTAEANFERRVQEAGDNEE